MLKTLQQIVRTGIVTEPLPAADDEMKVRELLDSRIREVLGRALCIRQVDAGSCNGCELEIHALGNPIYSLESAGIRFVASPRHADLLLVTGPVSRHMEVALRRTYDATPDPSSWSRWAIVARAAGSSARGTRAAVRSRTSSRWTSWCLAARRHRRASWPGYLQQSRNQRPGRIICTGPCGAARISAPRWIDCAAESPHYLTATRDWARSPPRRMWSREQDSRFDRIPVSSCAAFQSRHGTRSTHRELVLVCRRTMQRGKLNEHYPCWVVGRNRAGGVDIVRRSARAVCH
jgi:hypothetical protein